MVLTDAEELRSPVITSDMSFFDLESNHSRIANHLRATDHKIYRQSTLYVPLSLKQRVFLFTERVKSIWAGLPRCKPNKYFKVAFAFSQRTPLA
ncbi:ANM_HP_G0035270.mRNA.1.CDS.1 [Saccharomyces cerevisiae]|nr:ANM_HP_G0035270.mRNA.1.CDS.1 [Saccharomyces cerevisiae]CAI7025382.1 ANM_HP_G0035270.mRNA.1.CDS.1 [Saccharomyces cerevisiae]